MALKEISARNTETERFKFEKPGDCIEGYLLEKATITMEDGKELQKYVIENEAGLFSFLGSMHLNEVLAKVSTGVRVKITFVETLKTKSKRTVKKFKLLADTEDTIDGVA